MIIYTYISQSNRTNRFKYLDKILIDYQPSLIIESKYLQALYLNDLVRYDCDLFIVHKGDIQDVTILKALPNMPINVVLCSDAIVRTEQNGKYIEINSNLLRHYLPALISNFAITNGVDLSLLKGGWYQYYREIRDEFLDLYYDKVNYEFKETPNFQAGKKAEDYLKAFSGCKGYAELLELVKTDPISKILEIRDILNSFIVDRLNQKKLDS